MNRSPFEHTRRSFIRAAAAGSLAVTVGIRGLAAESRGEIVRRKLGRTGETVSAIGIGGSHVGRQHEDEESIRIVRTALDRGIDFLDNCWDYNGGASEIRMGKALRDGYRDKAFLITKIDGRDKATAARQIDESLQRLQEREIAAVLAKSAPESVDGSYELYKTSHHFDGTVQHPECLGRGRNCGLRGGHALTVIGRAGGCVLAK